MACCGGKRRAFRNPSVPASPAPGARAAAYRPPAPAAVFYEYLGEKVLTVIGSVSGRRYRFAAPGAVVAVDGRDSPAVDAVPGLRRVRR